MKRRYNLAPLEDCVNSLKASGTVPAKYKPHHLKGQWKGTLECHLTPDWLLVWSKTKPKTIVLIALGSHDDLF
jgi:mRNA interferase YafQ